MAYLFPHTSFGTNFKHAKGVEIVMGGIYSLSTYTHYCMSSLAPYLLVGKIDCPVQLAKGWNCQQAEFWHSDLGGSTNWEYSLMLLTPYNILLFPSPYAEVPKQPWNPMLDSVNSVNSSVTMSQLAQPEDPEAQVYGPKSTVWPCGLFPAGKMSTEVQVSCVYNSLPWDIRQLTINDLDTL